MKIVPLFTAVALVQPFNAGKCVNDPEQEIAVSALTSTKHEVVAKAIVVAFGAQLLPHPPVDDLLEELAAYIFLLKFYLSKFDFRK